MNRAEHLEWCKVRALEYVDNNDLAQAWASMLSDMSKHPETKNHSALELGTEWIYSGLLKHKDQIRDYINGFN